MSIEDTLKKSSLDFNESFSEYVEFTEYIAPNVTLKTTLGKTIDDILKQFPSLMIDKNEGIVKISDYNKAAKIH